MVTDSRVLGVGPETGALGGALSGSPLAPASSLRALRGELSGQLWSHAKVSQDVQ